MFLFHSGKVLRPIFSHSAFHLANNTKFSITRREIAESSFTNSQNFVTYSVEFHPAESAKLSRYHFQDQQVIFSTYVHIVPRCPFISLEFPAFVLARENVSTEQKKKKKKRILNISTRNVRQNEKLRNATKNNDVGGYFYVKDITRGKYSDDDKQN